MFACEGVKKVFQKNLKIHEVIDRISEFNEDL